MALSLVLDLVGGEVFQLFTGSVTKAVERKAAFKDLLQDIKYTLASLKRQASVIRQIQQYNLELDLSNNEIIDIAAQMTRGRELIDRLSGIKFRLWNFCCTNDCAEQLKELNRLLQSLFDAVQLEQVRDAKETLILARQNRDDFQKLKVLLEKILQKIDDPEVKGLLRRLADQTNSRDLMDASTSSSNSTSASASASVSNTEDEGNGLAQAKSLEALVEAAFGLLIDAILEVKERTKMFIPLFKRLKSTLDCLRPFIIEMAQDKKVLDRPKEELQNLKIQMENGAELVRNCSSVYRWTSNKKDKYTNQVVELDECLQGHLSILTVEVARNVRETSSLVSNIQEVVNRIRGSDFQGSCDIVEPPIPPVDLEVKETLVSEVNITEGSGGAQNLLESKDSCDVVGSSSTPTVGFEESQKRRKDLIKDTVQRGSLFPKRPGQPLCSFYMETGDCKLGLDCIYHHPDSVSSPTGLPLRPIMCTPLLDAMKCSSFYLGDEKDEPESPNTTFTDGDMKRSGSEFSSSDASTESLSRSQYPSFSQRPSNLRIFTVSELKSATKNFGKSGIGEGGFGCVYKGQIWSSEDPSQKIEVAVKQLSERGFQGHKEWVTEVNVLGVVEHPNLVKLVGYCAEDDERGIQRLLIYEYMPNGSVEDHLSSPSDTPLSWAMRLKIAQDAARGLTYLHEEMDFQIIFREFKSSNILLDKEWNAKLSDFGMARLCPAEGVSHVSTEVGGYAAPEYIQTGRLTSKIDVWSYGVFLYELITGRCPLDRNRPKSEQKLLEWVRPYLSDLKKFRLIIDPRLEGKYPLNTVLKLASVANRCLARLPKNRPKMSEVLEMVNQIVEVTFRPEKEQ